MAELKFNGQLLAQNNFVTKTGKNKVGLLFLDMATQKQFQLSGVVAVDPKMQFVPIEWVVDVELEGGSFGKSLYGNVVNVSGSKK